QEMKLGLVDKSKATLLGEGEKLGEEVYLEEGLTWRRGLEKR
ncbi:hypothetical protein A2U01_0063414, partial [Trifolium medium]|nr:hypothetical protein [Trifolium medium]